MSEKPDYKWYNDTIKLLYNAELQVQEAIDRRDFIKHQLESFDQKLINDYKLKACYCGDIPEIVTGNMINPYVKCSCGAKSPTAAYVISAIRSWNNGERTLR